MVKQTSPTRSDAEQEIKEVFGFVPKFYSTLPAPSVYAHWSVQRDLELSDETALDYKTKELIGLAVAAQIKCQYCTYFHTRAAQTFGATKQELQEAVAIGGMTSLFSDSLNGMQYDIDEFKPDVERALEAIG